MGNSIKFGTVSVGGNLQNIQVDGDIIWGDKIMITTTGFKQEQDKQDFLKQIEELRATLRQMLAEISNAQELDQETKDGLVLEVAVQINQLGTAKTTAKTVAVAQQVPEEERKTLEDCLKSTETLLDKVKSAGKKVAEWTATLAHHVEIGLSILVSAKQLFGMP